MLVASAVAFCGDAVVEGTEECDLGGANGAPLVCCNADCTLRGAGEVCRSAIGSCDAAETCDGVSATCPADGVQPAGTLCNSAGVGECDADDVCDGVSKSCPAAYQPAGTPCSDDGNVCTVDECDGTSPICQHTPGNAGVICQPAGAGECDADDVCDGVSASCPTSYKPAGAACSDDGNVCTFDRRNGFFPICVHSPKPVALERQARVDGTVPAPERRVRVGIGAIVNGAILAEDVRLLRKAVVSHHPFIGLLAP